jgi:hypothetical protein
LDSSLRCLCVCKQACIAMMHGHLIFCTCAHSLFLSLCLLTDQILYNMYLCWRSNVATTCKRDIKSAANSSGVTLSGASATSSSMPITDVVRAVYTHVFRCVCVVCVCAYMCVICMFVCMHRCMLPYLCECVCYACLHVCICLTRGHICTLGTYAHTHLACSPGTYAGYGIHTLLAQSVPIFNLPSNGCHVSGSLLLSYPSHKNSLEFYYCEGYWPTNKLAHHPCPGA